MIVDIKRQLYAWWCEVCGGSCTTDDWRYHHPAHTGRILIKSAENIADRNKKINEKQNYMDNYGSILTKVGY